MFDPTLRELSTVLKRCKTGTIFFLCSNVPRVSIFHFGDAQTRMPSTTVPSAVFQHPTALAPPVRGFLTADTNFDPRRARATDFDSAGSSVPSYQRGSELGLQARRVFYGAPGSSKAAPDATPLSATTRIQDAGHYQLESRRAMLKCIARLFTIEY